MASNATTFATTVTVTPGTTTFRSLRRGAYNGLQTFGMAQIIVNGGLTAPKSFSYDNDGNMLSDGSRTFTWDVCNRLTSIRYSADPQVPAAESDFAYDGLGRRAQILEKTQRER